MKKYTYTLGLAALLSSPAFAATINVTADITANTTWTADNTYILDRVIYVTGATLDIAPGTIVRGQPDENSLSAGSLVVRPDGKIQVRGTATTPVIFTTAALDVNGDGNVDKSGTPAKPVRWTAGNDASFWDKTPASAPMPALAPNGDKNMSMWGGLVLMGDAFTNNSNQVDVDGNTVINTLDVGQGIVEGLESAVPPAVYGGFNEQHNAGSIKYVSIRHGGIGLAANKEINALTCYAVGKDTTIENVDVYCTSDDGIEIFGGDVNLKNINVNYADDDGFDVDEGWRGSVQFLFVLQGLGFGDSGMEIDGEDKSESQAGVIDPLPNGRIYNATVWMNNTAQNGARLRAGWAGTLANSVFQNIGGVLGTSQGIRVDSTSGVETTPSARTNFGTGALQIRNNAVYGFNTQYTSFTDVLTLSSTGAVSGTIYGSAIPNAFYPATLNRSNVSTMFNVGGISHTAANGVDPRPLASASSLAYGTTQDPAYVTAPLAATTYKGAFDRTAASLWTTGWTALNKIGVLKN
jgi:hypothetical protein